VNATFLKNRWLPLDTLKGNAYTKYSSGINGILKDRLSSIKGNPLSFLFPE
jgi:hypothetical protein